MENASTIQPNSEQQESDLDMTLSLRQNKQQKALSGVVARIRESLDIETIFKITVTEVRQLLKTDRVGVFRFYPELGWEGEFIYEDVGAEWGSALAGKVDNHCFAAEFAALYQQGRIKAMADIYQASISDCHVQMLERFQVRANITAPLMKGKDLWGLVCIHQCSSPREWEASEIEFVQLIAEHLGVALQQADYLEQVKLQSAQLAQAKAREKAAVWQKTIAITIEKIRQFLDLESIFHTSTAELRQLLNADRVAIYRFNSDWSGEFVFESVAEGWVSLMEQQLHRPELKENVSECSAKDLAKPPVADTYLQDTQGGSFGRCEVYRVCNDIYSADFSDCYIKTLEIYQARAYVIIAIYHGQNLWGMLAVYQNARSRDWEKDEVYFLTQVSSQLGVALQQAESLKQVQVQAQKLAKAAERERKAAQREKALFATVEKIRQSLDIATIFATSTEEVRRLLEVDRVTIYRFGADWSGEFVAESLAPGWTPVKEIISAMFTMVTEPFDKLRVTPAPFAQRLVEKGRSAGDATADDYLQKNQVRDFANGQTLVIKDIYSTDYSIPYIALIERMEARAYMIVPIFLGEKLWGLLAAYQNIKPRDWQEDEIDLLMQIGTQLGVGLQQAELLEQTQRQKEEITQTLKELQRTQSQLIQSEKMAGLGQLVAGVAHEINNPISFIYGNITYVNEHTENLFKLLKLYHKEYPKATGEIQKQAAAVDLDFISDDLPKILASIKMGANRISQLVLSLRIFSRLDEAGIKAIDLHEGIDSTLLILQHRLQSQSNSFAIEVVKQYGELPPVVCYAAQMNQVFMNILNNAIDALENSATSGKIIDNPKIWIRTEVIEGDTILIWIADNGCGIPEMTRSRIFEPFFTTKQPGQGTGLGLSISYQIIVEKHGGNIKCVSEPGNGCEFWIEIPMKRTVS
ncbi:MAG: GAF domain-containing protein [Nostoc sp. NMS7]|uniref:GAF domain-containing sensor histidine kinase n=1 Tax=Nostoc sp. NMS7 TaxID=2815391 RepID=UPI0025F6E7D4|nr:GAF domain-containing protein [Nostoc sp. NMS7]MBN3950509.1 GAF domain-containing protein [Nostoc sp. NMS7]